MDNGADYACELASESFGNTLQLLRITPAGSTQYQNVVSTSSTASALNPGEMIPDGSGGMLAYYVSGGQPTIADVSSEGVTQQAINQQATYGQDNNMVLGENNTAFVTDGTTVTALSVPGLQVLWNYVSTGGTLSFVATTAGGGVTINDSQQGIIQLDANGNAATPIAALEAAIPFLAQTSPLAALVAGTGPWATTSSGDLAFIAGPAENLASEFAQPAGDPEAGRAPRVDIGIVWCSDGSCSKLSDKDVSFVYYQDNPTASSNNVQLTAAQQITVQDAALAALKQAFADYPAVFVAMGHPGMHTVYIAGEYPQIQNGIVPCGDTNPFATSLSRVYYLYNMEQAQWALGVQLSTPNQTLLQAIGEGIGNNSAHEVGHQLRIDGMDDVSTVTYNGSGCDGEKSPWVFTGVGRDKRTKIHWEPISARSLKAKLGE